jgi:hypothetical protein
METAILAGGFGRDSSPAFLLRQGARSSSVETTVRPDRASAQQLSGTEHSWARKLDPRTRLGGSVHRTGSIMGWMA